MEDGKECFGNDLPSSILGPKSSESAVQSFDFPNTKLCD